MYSVVLCLDGNKSEYDPTRRGSVNLARVETEEQAWALIERVARDLQQRGFYVEDRQWRNLLSIRERKSPVEGLDAVFAPSYEAYLAWKREQELPYAGCLFYLEDKGDR